MAIVQSVHDAELSERYIESRSEYEAPHARYLKDARHVLELVDGGEK